MNYSTNKIQVSYMMTWERVHTVVTVFLPHHSLVTSILMSHHNQISQTTQIPRPFPHFGLFSWLFIDLCQISWYFQVSRNSSGNPDYFYYACVHIIHKVTCKVTPDFVLNWYSATK